ncbi:hypothetical protein ACIPI6_31530 [Pseudomonas protegens]|uniref:hypothetical protein n=1 Tax=Pseudomonas protegens TaxID=380021 RepID=UPI003818705B
MSVYKDAGHCISRVMSIEAHDGTAKPAWQNRYKATIDDELLSGRLDDGLTLEERTTQDAMTRALLKRVLAEEQWHALAGKYSINESEVQTAARYLIPRVVSPAHHLFKTKCVMAWMVPERRNGLPSSFYQIHTWDAEGTPDRTLRRWRQITMRWLDDRVNQAHAVVEGLLEEHGLLLQSVA